MTTLRYEILQKYLTSKVIFIVFFLHVSSQKGISFKLSIKSCQIKKKIMRYENLLKSYLLNFIFISCSFLTFSNIFMSSDPPRCIIIAFYNVDYYIYRTIFAEIAQIYYLCILKKKQNKNHALLVSSLSALLHVHHMCCICVLFIF